MHAINRASVGRSAAGARIIASGHAYEIERIAAAERRREAARAAAAAAIVERARARAAALAADTEAAAAIDAQISSAAQGTLSIWQRITVQVAERHGLGSTDLTGPDRTRLRSWARQEAWYRIAAETALSLPAIGRHFGGRDHTTVLHGIRTYAARARLPMPRSESPEGRERASV